MRRIGLILALAVAGLVLPGTCAQAQGKSSTTWTGADLYRVTCARCHAERPPVERSDKHWKIIMSHMRVRANLTAEEAEKILEYLQASN